MIISGGGFSDETGQPPVDHLQRVGAHAVAPRLLEGLCGLGEQQAPVAIGVDHDRHLAAHRRAGEQIGGVQSGARELQPFCVQQELRHVGSGQGQAPIPGHPGSKSRRISASFMREV